MDTVEFISQSLEQVHVRLVGTCDGLNDEEAAWRPKPHANNIGFILWHVARGEDHHINRLRATRPDLWESEGWYERFDHPVDRPDPGDRMGLHALPVPSLSVLMGYIEATHWQTRRYLSTLTADALGDAVPSQPELIIAASLRHLITHKNNHHGQIDFIRGLQDETWDLRPGTGVVLPPSP